MIDEIKWLCAFTKYTTQKVIIKLHISMLICWYYRHLVLLTLNATNLTWKPSGNCIFRHLGRWVFHIFPRFHLIMGVTHQYFPRFHLNMGVTPMFFTIFLDVTIFNSSPMKHLRWSSFWQKIHNGWKLLLSDVTKSFVLNKTGFLDPTLKYDVDKFRSRQ